LIVPFGDGQVSAVRKLVRSAAIGGALALGAAAAVVAAPHAQAAAETFGAAYVWADQPTAAEYPPHAS
jgi:hypothetical protein